jgi:CyaY protein
LQRSLSRRASLLWLWNRPKARRAEGASLRGWSNVEPERALAPMTSESEFVAVTDRVLAAIGASMDAAIDSSDADLDWSLNDGVLSIDCGAGGKLVVNRHVPNREIWVAARSGGFHFHHDAGSWRDTRSGQELGAALSELLRLQADVAIAFPVLPAI